MAEDYVHRIGRAGMGGEALSLVCHDERGFLKDIEKLIRKTLDRSTVEGFELFAVAAPRPAPQPRGPRPQGQNNPKSGDGQRRGGPPQHRSGSRHR